MVGLSFPELLQVCISLNSLSLCIYFIIKEAEQSFKICLSLNHENNRKTVSSTLPVIAEMIGSFQHIITFLKYCISFAIPKIATSTRLKSLEVCIVTILVKFVKYQNFKTI